MKYIVNVLWYVVLLVVFVIGNIIAFIWHLDVAHFFTFKDLLNVDNVLSDNDDIGPL